MLRVLIVCTANVCRSPYLEARLRELSHDSALMFDSAGTAAVPGERADPRLSSISVDADAAMSSHSARRLDEISLPRRDLVLTAERRHRRIVVQRDPRMSKRTFTAGEFARLVQRVDLVPTLAGTAHLDDRSRLDVLLRRMREARASDIAAPPAADDLADPHGRSVAAYREFERTADAAAALISRALKAVVAR